MRKKGRSKRTWKKHVEEDSIMVGLSMENSLCRSRLSVGANLITAGLR